jgi:N-glycosylation protein
VGVIFRLVNYAPLAAVIRLISLNCINLWITIFIISLTNYDPELYLLAWIIIACVLGPILPG